MERQTPRTRDINAAPGASRLEHPKHNRYLFVIFRKTHCIQSLKTTKRDQKPFA